MVPRKSLRVRIAAVFAGAVMTIWLAVPMPAPTVVASRRMPETRAATDAPAVDDTVQRSIAEREYDASDAGSGLQAPNRAHGLRTYFDARGARVVDREDDARVLGGLRTLAVGRGEPKRLERGEVASSGPRVEIRRPGIVESFENSERGVEQTWTLSTRPGGDGPLAIEVDLGRAVDTVDGDRATVVAAGGRRLEYGGLKVWDATGAALVARMERATEGHVRLVIDDSRAVYPVTVDPTLTSPEFASIIVNQNQANLGYCVASAGDVNNDGYGDVIIGAPTYDFGLTDEGAAFLFYGSPSGIVSADAGSAAYLRANQAGAQLGFSVASAGDVDNDGYADVIVGAPYYDSGQADEGAAFVFLGSAAGIQMGDPTTAATTLQSDQVSALLGYSVASAGDVNDDGHADVVVGAVLYDTPGFTDGGLALVFLGTAAGIPNGNPTSTSNSIQGDQSSSRFGVSVAGAGDVNGDGYDDLIVGARLYDMGQTDEGAAFVFLGGAGGIGGGIASAGIPLQSNQANAYFGAPVAGAGDVNGDGFDDVIVAANSYDSGQTDEGAVFVFLGSASGIAPGSPVTANTTIQSNQTNAQLGFSASGAGDVNGDGYADVIVGARYFDNPQTDEGAALVYLGGPAGIPSGTPTTAAVAFLQSDQTSAQFGSSVACAGDVNGDGYADLVVGANLFDVGAADSGAAFVYLGCATGVNGYPPPDTTLQLNQANGNFGESVSSAGDVNGDGYDDVVVGAQFYDSGQTDEGAAFIFLGSPNGIASAGVSAAATTIQGNQISARFGYAVAAAGDVNGDGFDDVIVGTPYYDSGQTMDGGAAFVFLGGASGIPNGSPTTASSTIRSFFADDGLGTSVAGAGDVNGDGYDDVVIGNPGLGYVLEFNGGPAGIPSGDYLAATKRLTAEQRSASFGSCVAGGGDVNGDGFDDVVVGDPDADMNPSLTNEGGVFVFYGRAIGISTSPGSSIAGSYSFAGFGTAAAGAGDVNADGFDDVIAGSTNDQLGRGYAFIFYGLPSGLPSGSAFSVAGTTLANEQGSSMHPPSLFGYTVAGAGDVNGDGYADVVVGGREVGTQQPVAYVFLGDLNGVPSNTARFAAATLLTPAIGSIAVASVAGAGDVNSDGYADIVVGAPEYSNGQSAEGGAFIYSLVRPPAVVAGSDTVGIYAAGTGTWFLKNQNASGSADTVLGYGPAGSGWIAIKGDWDGDGDDTPGLYNPTNGFFFLRNTAAPGPADLTFGFGPGGAGWIPVIGDWDGDGTDTIGLYNPVNGFFFLRNSNAPGAADLTFGFGPAGAGWQPIAGDWDGDGDDTIGLYNPANGFFFLRNSNAPGAADLTFGFGPAGAGWQPVAGDFDGDGDDTVGLYAPSNGFFFLRNTNTSGAADLTFGYGPSNVTPIVGDWDGQ